MDIKRYMLELDGVREKSFLGVLVFRHPYCLSSNSTEFNADHENTCPFPCYISSFIQTFRDIYLHVIVQKTFFFNLFISNLPYMYTKYIRNNSYKNLFFIFLLYNTLTAKLDGNALAKKSYLLIKQLSVSTHSTKLLILLLLNILLQYSIHFI